MSTPCVDFLSADGISGVLLFGGQPLGVGGLADDLGRLDALDILHGVGNLERRVISTQSGVDFGGSHGSGSQHGLDSGGLFLGGLRRTLGGVLLGMGGIICGLGFLCGQQGGGLFRNTGADFVRDLDFTVDDGDDFLGLSGVSVTSVHNFFPFQISR